MAIFCIQDSWVFTFGIIGNIVSFMVYLAPAPTFYRIIKRKSTEGFQSLPYLVALFSSMLWIYYASLKPNAYLLISINTVPNVLGFVFGVLQMVLYLIYKNCNRVPEEQQKLPSTVKLETIRSVDRVHSVPDFGEDKQGNDLNKHGKTSCDEEIGMDASNQV
ncbi:hypothetical protein C3L33_14479, partial [Rhododendron williamsianum]